jgi:hypothetical protein
LDQGRATLSVIGNQSGITYVSTVVDHAEVMQGVAQPWQVVDLPFVSAEAGASLVIANGGAGYSAIKLSAIEAFDLGAASMLWTRYPRLVIRGLQKLFVTAVMLPLALLGTLLLIWRREGRKLIVLWGVPLYYFCFQSMLHTEYRYVLAIHYFMFVLAAVTLFAVGHFVCRKWSEARG